MSQPPNHWEVFALRYATIGRRRLEMFINHDLHDGPQAMDYFVWLLRRGDDLILIDTGFNAAMALERKRDFLRCPIDSWSQAGIDVASIRDVVITHAHYDHAGNLDLLPRARFHLQEREMAYATGRDMRQKMMRHAYCVDHVCSLVRLVFDDRVQYHDGDWELRPGVSVHLVGGHTRGLQVVRVHTQRGWIVLASDAAHYLENFTARSPFPIVADVGIREGRIAAIGALGADAHAAEVIDATGLHVLPGTPRAIALRPLAEEGAAAERFSRAFLLPPVQIMGEEAMLVLPRGWFQPDRILELYLNETLRRVRLVRLNTFGANYERVAFTELPTA